MLRAFLYFSSNNNLDSVAVLILRRHIVFRDFRRCNLALVRIFRVLHSAHHFRFVILSFFRQFRHAFRIHALPSDSPCVSPDCPPEAAPRPRRPRIATGFVTSCVPRLARLAFRRAGFFFAAAFFFGAAFFFAANFFLGAGFFLLAAFFFFAGFFLAIPAVYQTGISATTRPSFCRATTK